QSLLLTDGPDGERCVRTTTYHSFSLFKPHRNNTSVKTQTQENNPLGLSASASKNDKGQLVVSLVNPRADADWQVEGTIRGLSAKSATAQILHDADLNACNSFDQPDRLVPRAHPARIDGGRLMVDLPRLSVATVTIQTA
ncbi:MAG TPA: alpha-L-arabinofuranosidase C-terminal domain-containing protein, partial [Terriglobia bacterium]|nr:alpha-L-arabinofuranosidase C-terminal domain-containing protein [Terriglobia bacterium]